MSTIALSQVCKARRKDAWRGCHKLKILIGFLSQAARQWTSLCNHNLPHLRVRSTMWHFLTMYNGTFSNYHVTLSYYHLIFSHCHLIFSYYRLIFSDYQAVFSIQQVAFSYYHMTFSQYHDEKFSVYHVIASTLISISSVLQPSYAQGPHKCVPQSQYGSQVTRE